MLNEFILDVVAARDPGADADKTMLASLLPASGADEPSPAGDGERAERLTAYIYRTYHCRSPGDDAEGEGGQELARPETAPLLLETCVRSDYEARLGTRFYLDAGFWPVDRDGAWPRRYARDELVLLCREDEVEPAGDQLYALRFPRCLPYRSRGFVSFVGGNGPLAGNAKILRIYLSLNYEGSLAAVEALCSRADECGLSYLIKAVGRRSDYSRTDNVVLYIDHRDYESISPTLSELAELSDDSVVHDRPSIFCKPVARGISLAEEPVQGASGESFGLHRSRLMAEATLRLLTRSPHPTAGALEAAVRSRFSQDDVSAKFPYLSYSWIDPYG